LLLRACYVPDARAGGACIDVREDQTRYRAHSDYTGFTLLLQDDDDHNAQADDGGDGGGGLEIDIDGRWMPVLPRPGSFVVNIGDLFEVRRPCRAGAANCLPASSITRMPQRSLAAAPLPAPALDRLAQTCTSCILCLEWCCNMQPTRTRTRTYIWTTALYSPLTLTRRWYVWRWMAALDEQPLALNPAPRGPPGARPTGPSQHSQLVRLWLKFPYAMMRVLVTKLRSATDRGFQACGTAAARRSRLVSEPCSTHLPTVLIVDLLTASGLIA
jgi:hypothetical protein